MDIIALIEQFQRQQTTMIEEFANELRRTHEARETQRTRKRQLQNVYILKREGNTFSVRLQHKYGGKYLRGNIGTHEEAQRDAKYLDAATATPAQPAMDPDPVIQARQWARMFNERMPNAYGIEFGGEDSDLTRIDISFEDSALTRIAIALEHIAERLDEVSARGKLLDFPPKPKPAERPAPDTTLG